MITEMNSVCVSWQNCLEFVFFEKKCYKYWLLLTIMSKIVVFFDCFYLYYEIRGFL